MISCFTACAQVLTEYVKYLKTHSSKASTSTSTSISSKKSSNTSNTDSDKGTSVKADPAAIASRILELAEVLLSLIYDLHVSFFLSVFYLSLYISLSLSTLYLSFHFQSQTDDFVGILNLAASPGQLVLMIVILIHVSYAATLQVTSNSAVALLRKYYLKLSLIVHPDKNPGDWTVWVVIACHKTVL